MNYQHIADALAFYRERGYVYVDDAPWQVGRDAYYSTRPEKSIDVEIHRSLPDGCGDTIDGYLVASGEQSFLQMMLDGQALKKAICVTPCWRGDKYDAWHRPNFLKAELINAQDVDLGHLIQMVHDACTFFERYLPVRVIETDVNMFDIVEKGTRAELGSYGWRVWSGPKGQLEWLYGTACAEPRLSVAIEKHSRQVGR